MAIVRAHTPWFDGVKAKDPSMIGATAWYEAVPADPFVLNHRNFPTATMLTDAQGVLGGLVGGAGTTTIGCLGGAQIDRSGNINSTHVLPRPFLVGSGGGNDVASVAAENVVVATLTPQRTVAECSYVTSPGTRVQALVTDLGTFTKHDGNLVLTALAPGASVEQITVTMTNKEKYKAELVGTDLVSDISLLKIEGKNLPYIRLGNSDDVIIGEWVIALGNPFGLFEVNDKPTVTVGVVSATGMKSRSML